MRGVASPNVTPTPFLASPARTNGQFQSRCISARRVHLRPSKQVTGCRMFCEAGPAGLVFALPAGDGRRRHPDSMTWAAAAATATMSASRQTQTLPRGNTATKAPVKDKVVPKLDDGGFFPPGRDGGRGGGGGGGGGGNMAGGFVLFGFLLLMNHLKELEKDWITKRANRPNEIDQEDY